ncbi:MAG: hypothetical protein ABIO70_24570 [Pseudomonadota bacterium]
MDRRTVLFALPFALALPRAALALTCDEIAAMAGAGAPVSVVVQTIEASGTLFDPDDLACLAARGLPPEVLAAARAHARDEALGLDAAPGAAPSAPPDALERAIRLRQAHKPLSASLALADLLREGVDPAERGRIAFHLATCLDDLQMPTLAEHYLLEALRQGPADPWFERSLVSLVALGERTGDHDALQRVVARLPQDAWPRRVRPDLAWAAGLLYAERDEVGRALDALAQVPEGAHRDLQARYLEGVLLARQGHARDAAGRFKAVVNASVTARDREEARRLQELQNLAVMDIARLYYGIGRYEQALGIYGHVERDAEAWPQARFEAAWARLMANDPEGSLGELMTVRSPFFATDPWQPEAEVLRAISLYTLCDLHETTRVVTDFKAQVGPRRGALHAFVREYAPPGAPPLAEEAWAAWSGPRPPEVGPGIRATLGGDRDLALAAARLDRITAERRAVQAQKARWRDAMEPVLLPLLEAEQHRTQRRAGLQLLAEAAALDAHLADLLAQVDVIAFESGEAARQDYEELAAGTPPAVARNDEVYVYAPNQRDVYWPFNGEFWEDELGSYRVEGGGLCR